MEILKFRVVVDHEQDIFRDIEIQSEKNFECLHGEIIKAFNFRGDQMASFYMSNDSWEKGQEIGLMDMSFGEESGPPTMGSALLSDFVIDANQKILYVYDFLKMWIFYLELIEEKQADANVSYPRVTHCFGDAPIEDEKEIDDIIPESSQENASKSIQSEIEDIMSEFDDEITSEGGFDNIDDLDI